MMIRIGAFTGEVPRLPGQGLPDTAAVEARNCLFSHGELRPMPDDATLMATGYHVKSLYTPDGLRYFTWNHHAFAQRSPIPDDTHDRFYFLDSAGDLRVSMDSLARSGGGEPLSSWRCGVPQPDVPSISVSFRDNSLPDSVSVLEHTFYWEAGGRKYQEQAVTPVPSNGGRTFRYSGLPVKAYNTSETEDENGDPVTETEWVTPKSAVPVIRIDGKDEKGGLIFTLYAGSELSNDDTVRLKSSVVADLSLSNEQYHEDGLIQADAEITLTWTADETRAYVVTLVNSWGEEGPPSDPVIIRLSDAEKVDVVLPEPNMSDFRGYQEYRIYRTATGSSDTQFFYVDSVLAGSYSDEKKDEELGEELPSEGWYPPPENCDIIEMMPNGILAVAKEDTLYFSQPFLPHAYNPLDAIGFGHQIMAMKSHESGLVVVTTTGPYLIAGIRPDAMTQTRLAVTQAAVSKAGITRAGRGVVYASHDGLVVIGGATASLQDSQRLWTRDDWRKETEGWLSTISLAAHDGKIIAHWATRDALVIDLDEAGGQLTRCDQLGGASFVLPQTDGLYFHRVDRIYEFQAGNDARSLIWVSKPFVVPVPLNFGAIEIDVEGQCDVTVVPQEGTPHVIHADGYGQHPLPGGFRSRIWQIKVEGAPAAVKSLTLAGSLMELNRV